MSLIGKTRSRGAKTVRKQSAISSRTGFVCLCVDILSPKRGNSIEFACARLIRSELGLLPAIDQFPSLESHVKYRESLHVTLRRPNRPLIGRPRRTGSKSFGEEGAHAGKHSISNPGGRRRAIVLHYGKERSRTTRVFHRLSVADRFVINPRSWGRGWQASWTLLRRCLQRPAYRIDDNPDGIYIDELPLD